MPLSIVIQLFYGLHLDAALFYRINFFNAAASICAVILVFASAFISISVVWQYEKLFAFRTVTCQFCLMFIFAAGKFFINYT